jgi:short-subunit dehydrogenase
LFAIKGKCALVTGASSGIGEEFAQALASRGADLILVARSEEKLKAQAKELADQHRVQTAAITSDLTKSDAAEILFHEVQSRGRPVDLVVNCAGFGTYGRFDEIPADREHEELLLNVVAVVDLTHHFIADMVERRSGAVVNVASTTAFVPTPYMATYSASKAFILAFSEALWAEYRDRGIRVLAVCPGATKTRFFDVVGTTEAQWGIPGTPSQVVAAAFNALDRGRPTVVPGWFNQLYVNLPRFLPRSVVSRVAERAMRPRHLR